MSDFTTKYRTHTCGELRATHLNKAKPSASSRAPVDDMEVAVPRSQQAPPSIVLSGFADTLVDPRTFVIRDRYGKTLVTVDPGALPYVEERVGKLEPEDVVQVSGELALREKADPTNPTGEVWLRATKIELLSKAEPLPEGVLTDADVPLDDRLTFRQLYLRRPEMKDRLAFRMKVMQEMREYFLGQAFFELGTPQLFWYDKVATGPEAVPVPGGDAFALPAGSLVLDQYIIPGGFERFFQFFRVTRRETNPSPFHAQEHTALDINLLYVDMPDFLDFMDGLLRHVWSAVLGADVGKIERMTFADALRRFGTDRVDLRFGLELQDLPDAAPAGGAARAFVAPKAAEVPDAELDALCAAAAATAGGGTAVTWARLGDKPRGPASGTFAKNPLLAKKLGAASGDLVLVGTGPSELLAGAAAGRARVAAGHKLGLVDPKKHVPVWVHSYPMMELDEDGNLVPRVVVFARLLQEDKHTFLMPLRHAEVRSRTFDLIIDGMECASGYIGNHDMNEQFMIWKQMFRMSTPDLIRVRAPVESHRFGVPPHGGINVGFDRIAALLAGVSSLDQIMFFPKSPTCRDPMLGSPGRVPASAVADLVGAPPLVRKQTEDQYAVELIEQ